MLEWKAANRGNLILKINNTGNSLCVNKIFPKGHLLVSCLKLETMLAMVDRLPISPQNM